MCDAFMAWMDDAFMCVFFFFLSLYDLLWLCRYEMSCSWWDRFSPHSEVKCRSCTLVSNSPCSSEVPPPRGWWKSPLIIVSWLNIGYQWCVCPLEACLSVVWLCFIVVNVGVVFFFSLGSHCLRWQKFGCSSHVSCEAGESGLSSHIRLRFYSGLFT